MIVFSLTPRLQPGAAARTHAGTVLTVFRATLLRLAPILATRPERFRDSRITYARFFSLKFVILFMILPFSSSPFPLFPPVKSLFPSVAPVFPSFVFYVFFCGQSRFPMYLRGCLICSIRVLSVFHPWLTISASPYWFQASLGEHLPPSFV